MMLERLASTREGQDMCLISSPRRFSGLVIAPFLAVMLTLPATAQTSSAPEAQSTGTPSDRIQTKPTGAPASATETQSNTVAPIPTIIAFPDYVDHIQRWRGRQRIPTGRFQQDKWRQPHRGSRT